MFGLIILLITIAMLAVVLYAGINYINIDAYTAKMKETTINNDFFIYSNLINTYKSAYNVYPSSGNWESDLRKLKTSLPDNSKNVYSYQYDVAEFNVGVCFSKSVSKEEYDVIKDIHNRGITVLSNSCFDKNDSIIDDSVFPITISLTHWIKE